MNGNAKDAWKGLNTVMRVNQQKQPPVSNNPSVFANALKKIYARFYTHDYCGESDKLCQSVDSDPVTLVESDVVKCLSRVNPNKAPGPDGLRGRGLKVCADQFGPFLARFFQWFLNIHFVPRSWKMSTTMQIPKKTTTTWC